MAWRENGRFQGPSQSVYQNQGHSSQGMVPQMVMMVPVQMAPMNQFGPPEPGEMGEVADDYYSGPPRGRDYDYDDDNYEMNRGKRGWHGDPSSEPPPRRQRREGPYDDYREDDRPRGRRPAGDGPRGGGGGGGRGPPPRGDPRGDYAPDGRAGGGGGGRRPPPHGEGRPPPRGEGRRGPPPPPPGRGGPWEDRDDRGDRPPPGRRGGGGGALREACRTFQRTGACRFGDSCRHLHTGGGGGGGAAEAPALPSSLVGKAPDMGRVAREGERLQKTGFQAGRIKFEATQETDPVRLAGRQKQVDYGKNTLGYERYTRLVPRKLRKRTDPWTPDINETRSKRSWDGLVRQWRRKLHEWDPVDETGVVDETERWHPDHPDNKRGSDDADKDGEAGTNADKKGAEDDKKELVVEWVKDTTPSKLPDQSTKLDATKSRVQGRGAAVAAALGGVEDVSTQDEKNEADSKKEAEFPALVVPATGRGGSNEKGEKNVGWSDEDDSDDDDLL